MLCSVIECYLVQVRFYFDLWRKKQEERRKKKRKEEKINFLESKIYLAALTISQNSFSIISHNYYRLAVRTNRGVLHRKEEKLEHYEHCQHPGVI